MRELWKARPGFRALLGVILVAVGSWELQNAYTVSRAVSTPASSAGPTRIEQIVAPTTSPVRGVCD